MWGFSRARSNDGRRPLHPVEVMHFSFFLWSAYVFWLAHLCFFFPFGCHLRLCFFAYSLLFLRAHKPLPPCFFVCPPPFLSGKFDLFGHLWAKVIIEIMGYKLAGLNEDDMARCLRHGHRFQQEAAGLIKGLWSPPWSLNKPLIRPSLVGWWHLGVYPLDSHDTGSMWVSMQPIQVGCVFWTPGYLKRKWHIWREYLFSVFSFIEDVLCFPTAMLGQTVTAEGPKYP